MLIEFNKPADLEDPQPQFQEFTEKVKGEFSNSKSFDTLFPDIAQSWAIGSEYRFHKSERNGEVALIFTHVSLNQKDFQ